MWRDVWQWVECHYEGREGRGREPSPNLQESVCSMIIGKSPFQNGYSMIIRRAVIKNLHGHLNASLSFQPGINVLIGVNGSGKTSILNAIAWTLAPTSVQGGLPAALLLSALNFDEISIALKMPGIRSYRWLRAKRDLNEITIEIDDIEDVLRIPVSIRQTIQRDYRRPANDFWSDRLARQIDEQRDNRVLQYLDDLPGPLYLPLDRRWTEEGGPPIRQYRRRSAMARHQPISEVTMMAERAFRLEQHRINSLTDTLRNEFLASLFQVEKHRIMARVWTKEEIARRRMRIEGALEHLGLPNVEELADKYFSRLEHVATSLGGQTLPDEWYSDLDTSMWFEWIWEVGPLAFRIQRLIPPIEKYNEHRARTSSRSTAFLKSVNRFFHDNAKNLNFSSALELSVGLANGQQIQAQDLSSGELQVLILFTYLYFLFDDPDQEFPVFIDEPELSLHVAWQNQYVDSVVEANPNAQFIIATHSPEIAGQAEDRIIDISP